MSLGNALFGGLMSSPKIEIPVYFGTWFIGIPIMGIYFYLKEGLSQEFMTISAFYIIGSFPVLFALCACLSEYDAGASP